MQGVDELGHEPLALRALGGAIGRHSLLVDRPGRPGPARARRRRAGRSGGLGCPARSAGRSTARSPAARPGGRGDREPAAADRRGGCLDHDPQPAVEGLGDRDDMEPGQAHEHIAAVAVARITAPLSGRRRSSLGGRSGRGQRRESGRRAGEVEPAGAVEGFLGGAGEAAGGQDLVLIPAAAGQVERESPGRG